MDKRKLTNGQEVFGVWLFITEEKKDFTYLFWFLMCNNILSSAPKNTLAEVHILH